MAKKRGRRRVGDVVAVPLGCEPADDRQTAEPGDRGEFAFARVLPSPLMAFYDLKSWDIPEPDVILAAPILFKVCVREGAVTSGLWPVITNVELTEELTRPVEFFKQDAISGRLTIYCDSTGEERPATLEECQELECAAVWDHTHVVDRLNDHFAGRKNTWVELLRPE